MKLKATIDIAQIDILWIHKDSSGQCWSKCLSKEKMCKTLGPSQEIISRASFLLLHGGGWIVGQSAALWEDVDGGCQCSDLQKYTNPADTSMRFITNDRGISPSALEPLAVFWIFLSITGESKYRTKSLAFSLLRSLKWLIKMKEAVFYQHADSCGRIVPQTLLPLDF